MVPATIPDGRGRHALWPSITHGPDKTASVIVAGKQFRAIDSRCWDAARRLSEMDRDGVDVQVVSPMPELLSHWFEAADADALARHVNGATADLVARGNGRFVGFGMAPVQDPELAARRLQEVHALGLRGIEIGTHVDGVPLGDARLDPLYAAAEELNLAIMVHPLRPAGLERLGGKAELAAVAAFPLETAFAATSLLAGGVPERFPGLRILLSHGGGALPWILPRLDHAWGLGGGLKALFPGQPSHSARHFFYDTVLYSARSLQFLAETVGAERIVIGSDYPFLIQQERPGDFALQALKTDFDANATAFLDGTHRQSTAKAARRI
jgi:aminocarboxymuconate-semialdehyde decarboxylase